MTVTFKDVARLAKVSTQTVSRVINGSDKVAEKTRQRVKDAIRQLGYVPNKGAQMLSRAKLNIIGLITLDISLHGIALIVGGIRNQATEMSYATAISVLKKSSIEPLTSAIRELISQQIDAIIINLAVSKEDAETIVTQFTHLTFVFIDVPEDTAVIQINCDNKLGAHLGVEHLIEQGRTQLIAITGPVDSSSSQQRCHQWQQSLSAHQLSLAFQYTGNWQADSGYLAIKEALFKKISFDGVLVANDQTALGVLCALNEAGIHVPQEVSVIGFDASKESEFFSPPLTTIKQDFEELGKSAVKLLIKQNQDKIKAQRSDLAQSLLSSARPERVPVQLITRASTAKKQTTDYDKARIEHCLEQIKRWLPKPSEIKGSK